MFQFPLFVDISFPKQKNSIIFDAAFLAYVPLRPFCVQSKLNSSDNITFQLLADVRAGIRSVPFLNVAWLVWRLVTVVGDMMSKCCSADGAAWYDPNDISYISPLLARVCITWANNQIQCLASTNKSVGSLTQKVHCIELKQDGIVDKAVGMVGMLLGSWIRVRGTLCVRAWMYQGMWASLCFLATSVASMVSLGERSATLALDLRFMGKFE